MRGVPYRRKSPSVPRPVKQYVTYGLPGCVQRRTPRGMAVMVAIYRIDQARAGLDPTLRGLLRLLEGAGWLWATVCEVHGGTEGHKALSEAKDGASSPIEWCDGCRKLKVIEYAPR